MRAGLFLCLCFCSMVQGVVSVGVFENDGATPFNNRTISVGTELNFIVTSTASQTWTGALFTLDENIGVGELSAHLGDESLSVYAAAGSMSSIESWAEPGIEGYCLLTYNTTKPGDWFILDYTALTPGHCTVSFYDYNTDRIDPITEISFTQVIPEPMTLTLLGIGVAGILSRRRVRS